MSDDPEVLGREALERFWAEHGATTEEEYLARHPSTRQAWGRQPLGLTPREREAVAVRARQEADRPPSKNERRKKRRRDREQRNENGGGAQRSKQCSKNRRQKVYERDGFQCVVCRLYDPTGELLTLDHIIPRSKGGSNRKSNLQTMCGPCNNAKGDSIAA